jgi:hypothetical protein
MWNLSITQETYKKELAEQPNNKSRRARINAYHKAVKFFSIQGTTLMRVPETVGIKSDPLQLPARRVIMADAVYDEIRDIHHRLLHAGRDRCWDQIQRSCYGINRAEVEWFTTNCKFCVTRRPTSTKGEIQPIISTHVGERVQIDLIDMRAEPSGPYNWILHTHDHFSRFMTL